MQAEVAAAEVVLFRAAEVMVLLRAAAISRGWAVMVRRVTSLQAMVAVARQVKLMAKVGRSPHKPAWRQ